MRKPKLSLSIFLLAFVLTVPATFADQGKGKDKGKKGKTHHSQEHRGWHDENDDRGGRRDANLRFRGMDRNGDGRITRNEWRGNDQSFDNHDWNGDGVLSGAEVRPGAQGDNGERFDDRFDHWDRNDDGFLSRSEWKTNLRLFDRLDRNNDGLLSLSEWRDW